MYLIDQQRRDIGVALNEATLLGVEVDADRRVAGVTLRVLTLPESGPPAEDRRVQLLLWPVGRVAASLRAGWWDDPNAPAEPFPLPELLSVVQSFGGQAIYGWEFIDVDRDRRDRWAGRVSLDWRSSPGGLSHSLSLFQEAAVGAQRTLDLVVWFDEMQIRRADGSVLSLAEFCAGGRRWWDGLHAGDPRTDGEGIIPAK